MADQDEIPQETRIPIEWYVPESVTSQYATNLVVQHTEREFLISFFMTKPPLIVGTISKEVLDNIKSIRAECVAQIIVAADRLPGFLKALEINLETFRASTASKTTEEK